jgi:hypothetical protein
MNYFDANSAEVARFSLLEGSQRAPYFLVVIIQSKSRWVTS